MTKNIKKTLALILSVIMLMSAILSSMLCLSFIGNYSVGSGGVVIFGYIISPIITLVLSFIMSYNPMAAKTLAIPYSVLEGISIGTLGGLLKLLLFKISPINWF